MRANNRETADAILGLAERCVQRGEMYQAADICLRLLKRYPDTIEAEQAVEHIFQIAQCQEASGRRRSALSLYEKVAAFRKRREIAHDALKSAEQVSDGGKGIQQPRRRREGRNHETAEEIPFVDLTEAVELERNFYRLGEVQKNEADIALMANFLNRTMNKNGR